jgi:hypothetical protein
MKPAISAYVRSLLDRQFAAAKQTMTKAMETKSQEESDAFGIVANDLLTGIVATLQKLADHGQLKGIVGSEKSFRITAKYVETLDEKDLEPTGQSIFSLDGTVLPSTAKLRVYSGYVEHGRYVDVTFGQDPKLWFDFFDGATFLCPLGQTAPRHRSTVKLHMDLNDLGVHAL